MLTPGNKKLGERLIWGFGLASGTPEICVGLSSLCQRHCYAIRLERLRPSVHARYAKNLLLSRQRDFEQRLRFCILDNNITVLRIHTGGDFYSPAYTRKWLRIIQRCPQVRFFCYTRSWRHDGIRAVLERIAELPQARMWYSCDRETGVPAVIPARIRRCWLMTQADEVPPANMDLIFRTHPLRRQAQSRIGGTRVCPEEDGVVRRRPVSCDRCTLCWRSLPEQNPQRLSLPVITPAPMPEGSAENGSCDSAIKSASGSTPYSEFRPRS